MASTFRGHFKTFGEVLEATPDATTYGVSVNASRTYPHKDFGLLESNLVKESNNKVLEYGGSTAACWSVFSNNYELDYHIVETEECCKQGKRMFPEVSFYTDVPKLDKVDIFYVRSSLQYAEDWKSLLEQVIDNNNPTKIILQNTTTSEDTFYTVQYYYKNVLPYCYIGKEELTSFLEAKGYNQTHQKSNNGVVPSNDFVYEAI